MDETKSERLTVILIPKSDGRMTVNKTGTWRSSKPVVDVDKCKGCLLCWKFCPEACIEMSEDGTPLIDLDFCKGCGICEEECPFDAIVMVRDVK